MNEQNRLAGWLAQAILERDLSIRQAALYAGLNPSQMWNYAHGKAIPSSRSIRKLAAYFKVEPESLAAMLPGRLDAEPPPAAPFKSDNLEPVDFSQMSRTDAAHLHRLLSGLMRQLEARARDET